MPAVGSEQVGSRGSSSIDHRTTGVDSQARSASVLLVLAPTDIKSPAI